MARSTIKHLSIVFVGFVVTTFSILNAPSRDRQLRNTPHGSELEVLLIARIDSDQ
jgi:hypothetical protein